MFVFCLILIIYILFVHVDNGEQLNLSIHILKHLFGQHTYMVWYPLKCFDTNADTIPESQLYLQLFFYKLFFFTSKRSQTFQILNFIRRAAAQEFCMNKKSSLKLELSDQRISKQDYEYDQTSDGRFCYFLIQKNVWTWPVHFRFRIVCGKTQTSCIIRSELWRKA